MGAVLGLCSAAQVNTLKQIKPTSVGNEKLQPLSLFQCKQSDCEKSITILHFYLFIA